MGSMVVTYTTKGTKETAQTLKIVGRSDLNHSISWEIIKSEPNVTFSSRVDTVTMHPVTFADKAQTFVLWESAFSSDASLAAIQDSKFKKHECFADLQAICAAKAAAAAKEKADKDAGLSIDK